MCGSGARWRRGWWHAGLLIVVTLLLGSCAGHHSGLGGQSGDDGAPQVYPDNYKSEMLAAMHAYLNDPTGIRDAAISPPMLKPVANGTRYVVCLRFNGKENNGAYYAGDKLIAAEFRDGRFDDFLDAAASREPCGGVTFQPFPELEQLKP
jgi:hypothetical protein